MDEVEEFRRRCATLRQRIDLSLVPGSKISLPCIVTLLRLLDAELRFLSRLTHRPLTLTPNVGHLESLLSVILHPSVRHVSRLCRPLPTPLGPVHVDLVCTLARSPAWILVSHRSPNGIKCEDLRARIERVLAAANASLALRPAVLLLVFSRGVGDDMAASLVGELGASEVHDLDLFFEDLEEEGWVWVTASTLGARVFEFKIDSGCAGVPDLGVLEEKGELMDLKGDAFGSLISSMRASELDPVELINFDTTALVAVVSGISNGGTDRLLKTPKDETRERFKGNYKFVMAQVLSELHCPILAELEAVVAGRRGIICESVCSEFKELVSMYGGPNEKFRADQLVKFLSIVPDSPSARVMGLPSTRKIAAKNKIAFGTGDYWQAPTLTANTGFVRAVSQSGMSLLTVEHRPRALTGD